MVTPDAHYRNGSSEVFSSLVHRYGDVYLATGGINLEGVTASIRDATMVNDACAIVFDSSEWTSPDPTRNNVTLWASDHDISYDHYNPNHGVAANVRLHTWKYSDATISLQTDLIRRNDHPLIPVKFEYEHTFAYMNDYLGGVSVSLAGGVMSVSLPTLASTVWSKEQSAWV